MGKLFVSFKLANGKWAEPKKLIGDSWSYDIEAMKRDGHIVGNSIEEITVELRKMRLQEINSNPSERKELEMLYGRVWDTSELQKDFKVEGFSAPFVVVTRKSDGVKGSLEFQHDPRYYFNFIEYKKEDRI